MALLDSLCARDPHNVQRVLGRLKSATLDDALRDLCVSLTELVYHTPPEPSFQEAGAPSHRCASLLATALRPHLPGCDDSQLRALTQMMVWTADGMLSGALRGGTRPSREEASRGLLLAWSGLVADLARRAE
jgi:hypothetical protein